MYMVIIDLNAGPIKYFCSMIHRKTCLVMVYFISQLSIEAKTFLIKQKKWNYDNLWHVLLFAFISKISFKFGYMNINHARSIFLDLLECLVMFAGAESHLSCICESWYLQSLLLNLWRGEYFIMVLWYLYANEW